MNSTSLTNAVEDLKRQLLCPVCLEVFKDPCTLSPGCGHTFCRDCIRKLDAGDKNFPVCPQCQLPFDFKKLQISTTLLGVVEKVHSLVEISKQEFHNKICSVETKEMGNLQSLAPRNTETVLRTQYKAQLIEERDAIRQEINIIEALLSEKSGSQSSHQNKNDGANRQEALAKGTSGQAKDNRRRRSGRLNSTS